MDVHGKYEVTAKVEGIIVGVRQLQNRGRVQIPKVVREKLRIKDGDNVYWVEDKGRFYIVKAVEIK